jgi:hypothetical protein
MINAYRITVRKYKVRTPVKDLDTDQKIILKLLIKIHDTRVQIVAHNRECWWNLVNTVTNL